MAVAQPISIPDRPVEQCISIRTARLEYLDALKVVLTALVIAHHAGQPYGPTGGRWPIFEAERAAVLGPFFSVNAAFFMGLFFMISAYFLPSSFDRKGPWTFMKARFPRIGSSDLEIRQPDGTLPMADFEQALTGFITDMIVEASTHDEC